MRAGPAAVLIAPTGAGKTTRVPPALLAAGIGGGGQIVILEPRRIAARAAARRMAGEGGWTLGREVGYQIRFERLAGPETKILVVTEGILVQRLQADPFLEGVGVVIFDELHERNLATDLSLAMARRVQREVRPDLRLLAMSATLDPGPVAAFLGGCPTIESQGRLHPVEILYADRPDDRSLPGQVAAGVRRLLAMTPGDLLAFLPGVGEIQRCAEALAGLAAEQDLAVLPLYGDLPAERQDEVLRPSSRRRVVLATNVAESSITVDGVTAVIDSGLVRRLRFDPASGLDRLELGRVSRASADQRAGRAGRQAPGYCLRLWPAYEHAALPERETPEIARVDLAGPALQLASWGESDLAAFDWFEAPPAAAIESALALLRQLGALGDSGVTAIGRTLARLPVHPRLGRLLVEGCRLGVPRQAALLAALLSERDPFPRGAARRRPPPGLALGPPRPSGCPGTLRTAGGRRRGSEPGGRPLRAQGAGSARGAGTERAENRDDDWDCHGSRRRPPPRPPRRLSRPRRPPPRAAEPPRADGGGARGAPRRGERRAGGRALPLRGR